MDNIWLMLLLQVVLIFLNAVFACAEIAVISVNSAKLDYLVKQGNSKAKKLKKLTDQPARFLATIQVAITLSGFLGSAFAADNFSEPLVDWLVGTVGITFIPRGVLDSVSVILITLILSYFTLVFGELVPKRVAQRKSEELALGIAPTVSFISKLFAPIVFLLTHSTNGILRLLKIDPDADEESVSEEDIRLMADAGQKKGFIDEQENEVIQNVFEFDDLTAGEIATHRTEVSLLMVEETDEEWEQLIHDSRHTFYPVCEENEDNIIGVLNAKDYFRLDSHDRKTVMEQAVRPAYFVPESVKADLLLKNMKENRTTFAVVLDEHGGMEGIVTVSDLVECLIGDFAVVDSDADEEEPSFEMLEEGVWKVHGDADIDELAKAMNVELPDGDFETFNGLVFELLEAVPEDGSSFETETDTLKICVTDVQNHQVETAIVYPKKTETEEEEDSDN